MRFFTPLQLKKAMFSQPDRMRALGRKLDGYLPGSGISDDFLAACDQQDNEALNHALTKAVSSLLGTDDIPAGLEAYCRKCGVSVSLAGMSDMNKVRCVTDQQAAIRFRLSQEGV